jgi:hypothetical protein
MMKTLNTPTAQLVGGLLLGAVVFVAFAVGQDLGSGLVSGGLVIAFVVLVHVGRRRSQSLEVMSGIGDERTRHLYTGATAFAGSVMALVLPVRWRGRARRATRTRRSARCARLRPDVDGRGDRAAAALVGATGHSSRRRSSPTVCAGSSNTSAHV